MSQTLQLIAAPFTPFFEDGTINYSIIPAYVDKLQSHGISGVFVAGTTGEGLSLSEEERRLLAEEWRKATRGRLRMIVHVGHTCLESAKELALHANTIGAEGIAAIGPVFFTNSNPKALAELYGKIAEKAPSIPFFYYHMPSMSRVANLGSEYFTEMSKEIPNFGGIKFTHEDISDFQECLKKRSLRQEAFFGRDELLLHGLVLGARSAVGSTYNFASPLYLRIYKHLCAGEIAEAANLQSFCADAIKIMVRFKGLSGIRATLALCGIDCGFPRLPLEPLNESEVDALKKCLQDFGYFARIEAELSGLA